MSAVEREELSKATFGSIGGGEPEAWRAGRGDDPAVGVFEGGDLRWAGAGDAAPTTSLEC